MTSTESPEIEPPATGVRASVTLPSKYENVPRTVTVSPSFSDTSTVTVTSVKVDWPVSMHGSWRTVIDGAVFGAAVVLVVVVVGATVVVVVG
ncbi:MAG: hypothetical protein ACO36F_07465, partial [Ilumatobacteraceae bacterium]